MPAVFAFADKMIQDPQTATFAAFGSFAMLVLADFTGSARTRLLAYSALAVTGAAFVVLGTLCSRTPWLGAAAMAAVGFAVLFSGVINGYFAAGGTAALLTFVLPVTIRAPNSAVPARLEGWGLAAAAGICAVLLLWPARGRRRLRAAAGEACRALAALAEAKLADDRGALERRARDAQEAVAVLRRRFVESPHRPTGPTGATAALAALVDELDWFHSFLIPAGEPASLELCREENAAALRAIVGVLYAAAARLEGRDDEPDLARLDETKEALTQALARRLGDLPAPPDERALVSGLEPAFRIRAMTYSARQIAGYAMGSTGASPPELLSALEATEQLAVEHASVRSIWFRNSVRAAAGLAVAVYIAQRTGLQHAFWVVLGTLSVLRSNALATGSSVLRALAGTAVGILVGAGLVIAIGTHEVVLWAVLPVAVLLAAYAPRAVSFAAGQAGFTVVLFVLFNLIQPVGWKVGIVRIEDVAIGFAISLGVGVLFWPRGAATLLRENLAAAYSRGAEYVVAATRQLIGDGDPTSSAVSGQAANGAVHRLDDAFRQYLTERSAKRADMESVAGLVAGATRVRRVGESISALGRMTDGAKLGACGHNLDGEVHALRSWYVTFGDSIVNATSVPPPHIRDAEGLRRLVHCVHDAVTGGDESQVRPALMLLWASQHLDNLWRLESRLGDDVRGPSPGVRA